MVYKGLEIMQMISKGQIEEKTRFDFKNKNFNGEVKYYNGTLYWIKFDKNWNEIGKRNLFEMFNIQSTMVADFEPLKDKIDIDNIKELYINDKIKSIGEDEIECWTGRKLDITVANKMNEILQAVKQIDKRVKKLEEK